MRKFLIMAMVFLAGLGVGWMLSDAKTRITPQESYAKPVKIVMPNGSGVVDLEPYLVIESNDTGIIAQYRTSNPKDQHAHWAIRFDTEDRMYTVYAEPTK